MSWIFRSTSSHAPDVLGLTTPSDLNVVNYFVFNVKSTTWPLSGRGQCKAEYFVLGQATPSVFNHSAICPVDNDCTLDRFWVTTYPLTLSQGGACCFDRPCPVVIVRSSLDEVRSICVVFVVKYISSCVCASTCEHLITRSYYRCNGSFGDMLHSTPGIYGTWNILVYACPNTNRLVCENG